MALSLTTWQHLVQFIFEEQEQHQQSSAVVLNDQLIPILVKDITNVYQKNWGMEDTFLVLLINCVADAVDVRTPNKMQYPDSPQAFFSKLSQGSLERNM